MKKLTRKRALEAIMNHFRNLNISFNEKGYVASFQENLIDKFDNWSTIERELLSGQGSELKPDRNGTIKFQAIHSSSALAVNNFAPIKKLIEQFSFYNYSSFKEIRFEKKLPTGISTPNLDIYMESDSEIVGFESKFTEFLSPKIPNHNNNLCKYLNRKELDIDIGYNELIQYYSNVINAQYLDVAQLLKHGIGLIKKCNSKLKSLPIKHSYRPVLVYIYWQPCNWDNFEIYSKHSDEINDFKKRIEEFLIFVPLSYNEFWNLYENDIVFGKHIQKVKNRYSLEI